MAEFHLKLTRPVAYGEGEIRDVTLRSPSVSQFKALLAVVEIEDAVSEAEATIAILSGLELDAIGEMAFEDFVILAEAAAPLLETALVAAGSVFASAGVH